MEVNYPVIVLVIAVALLLIVLMVRRNQKDRKTFEKDMSRAEIKPEKHGDDEVRM